MAVTIKDIADYAGVSVGTVSKVLNNQGNVSDKLRLRIESVIEKFNYRPSAMARNIKKNKTDIVSLIIPQILNSFYVQIIDLIEKQVNEKGYTLMLCNSAESFDTELKYLKTFSTMRIAGLILATSGLKHEERVQSELVTFTGLNIPIALIVRSLERHAFDTVVIDNVKGAYQATRCLIRNNHRRIGIISSSVHTSSSQERIRGYMKALEEFQIPHDTSLIHIGGWTLDSGYRLTNQLLSLADPPTAIFVASNVQMIGAIKALKEKKINMPEDMSLICFDDTDWSSFVDPPITVVRPLTRELCQMTTDFLFSRIEGTYLGIPRKQVVPTEIVIRESVSIPKASKSL